MFGMQFLNMLRRVLMGTIAVCAMSYHVTSNVVRRENGHRGCLFSHGVNTHPLSRMQGCQICLSPFLVDDSSCGSDRQLDRLATGSPGHDSVRADSFLVMVRGSELKSSVAGIDRNNLSRVRAIRGRIQHLLHPFSGLHVRG